MNVVPGGPHWQQSLCFVFARVVRLSGTNASRPAKRKSHTATEIELNCHQWHLSGTMKLAPELSSWHRSGKMQQT